MSITPEEAWRAYQSADLLYSLEEVTAALGSIASEIDKDLSQTNPILVCVMNGGIVSFADIMRQLNFPFRTDYIHATRYGGNLTGGQMSWLAEPKIDPKDQNVVVIDDILDEGVTLENIVKYFIHKGAHTVRTAVLVVKDRERQTDYMADYVGLHVPDRYVFGCGMDYKGYLRNLPGIYAENPQEI